jgi:large subunit ribosomal protein L17
LIASSRNIKNGLKGKKKMRHRKSGKKLGRTWEHRKAMFRNMAKSLIVHERIKTTVPKAKELSKIVDKLVTLAIRNDLSAKRQAYKVLENHKLVQRLFNEIGPKFSNGKGGYTRVVKFAAPRLGDSAAMALIEFTYFDSKVEEKTKPKTAASAAVTAPVARQEISKAPEAPEEVQEDQDEVIIPESTETTAQEADFAEPLVQEEPEAQVPQQIDEIQESHDQRISDEDAETEPEPSEQAEEPESEAEKK